MAKKVCQCSCLPKANPQSHIRFQYECTCQSIFDKTAVSAACTLALKSPSVSGEPPAPLLHLLLGLTRAPVQSRPTGLLRSTEMVLLSKYPVERFVMNHTQVFSFLHCRLWEKILFCVFSCSASSDHWKKIAAQPHWKSSIQFF